MTGESPSRRARDLSILDLLLPGALLALAFVFWELNVLRSGSTLISLTNFDLFSEFLPRHTFASAALRRGEIPLWDSHQIGGFPFVASFQGGIFYPPNLLYAVLPPATAMGALGLLHVGLAGIFMFLLCRELGRSRGASWLAGVTFMLGGSTLFMIYHTNAINSVAWLPAALYCTTRLGREGHLRWALWLGLTLALQFLAGRDYTFVMTAHAVGLFVVFQVAWMIRDGSGARRVAAHLGRIGLGAALAGGLVAVQALPTLFLAAGSGRSVSGLQGPLLEIFGPMEPSLFLANLVNPARGAIRREYFGWIPLAFFLIGFRLWGRDRPAVFASVISLLAVVLCFGSETPLYEAYRMLPLGSVFRLPDRFLFLFSLGLSIGAGCGFDRIFASSSDGRARLRRLIPNALLLLAFGAGLTIAVGSGWLERGLAQAARPWGWFSLYGISQEHYLGLSRAPLYFAAATALLAAGLWRAGRRGSRLVILVTLAFAVADLGFALRNPFLHPARDTAPALSGAACYQKIAPLLEDYGRHLSLRLPDSYGIKDKDGELFSTFSATHYDPLVTQRQAAYFSVLQEGGEPLYESPWSRTSLFMGFLTRLPAPDRLKLLDLLGTDAILADGRTKRRAPALSAFLSHFQPSGRCEVSAASGAAPVVLYENPNALPRAFLVQKLSLASGPEEAFLRLADRDFDPRREAIVESGTSLLPDEWQNGGAQQVTIASYGDTKVALRARSEKAAFLVLTDTYDADWKATLNGEPVTVYPTNGLFRGVRVPAGESEIVFRYRPVAFYWGAVVSAVAAVLWLLLWRRSRASSP